MANTWWPICILSWSNMNGEWCICIFLFVAWQLLGHICSHSARLFFFERVIIPKGWFQRGSKGHWTEAHIRVHDAIQHNHMMKISAETLSPLHICIEWQLCSTREIESFLNKCLVAGSRQYCQIPLGYGPVKENLGVPKFDLHGVWTHDLCIRSTDALPTELRGQYGSRLW